MPSGKISVDFPEMSKIWLGSVTPVLMSTNCKISKISLNYVTVVKKHDITPNIQGGKIQQESGFVKFEGSILRLKLILAATKNTINFKSQLVA